jgi:hypothetical protein
VEEDSGMAEGEEEPVDPEEVEEARKTLLDAGLTEDDLKDLSDNEIVDLAEEYTNQNGKEPEDEVPRQSSA